MNVRLGQYFLLQIFCLLFTFINVLSSAHAKAPTSITIDSLAPYQQVIAISDIHGYPEKLKSLLRYAGLLNAQNQYIGKNTLLIVVGDSIQKGPQSLPVLNFLMNLEQQMQEAGGQMIHLLGNHENDQLADVEPKPELLHELESAGLNPKTWLDADTSYGMFFKKMPLFAFVSDAVFVHAGFMSARNIAELDQQWGKQLSAKEYNDLLSKESPVEHDHWLLDRADFEKNIRFLKNTNTQMIGFGHNRRAFGPTFENEIILAHFETWSLLKLDTGFFKDEDQSGQLIRWKVQAGVPLSQLPNSVVSLAGTARSCRELLLQAPQKKR